MNLKDFQETNNVDENLWENCYQAKAETSDLDEIEEIKEYKETIVISKETAEELDNLLYLEDIDFNEKKIAKDSTIETFTANFKNGYSMDIKVCAGEDNCFLDIILFDKNSSQVDCMCGEDTILGTFEFEDENVKYITEIVVGKLFEIEVDKDSME